MPEKVTREITLRPHARRNWGLERHREHERGDFDWTLRDVVRVVDTHDGYLRVDRILNGKPVSEICFKHSCERISGISVEDG
jgi:hypothetical protein